MNAHVEPAHAEPEAPRFDPYAPVCHYCGEPAVWSSTSAHLYAGREYGPVWECRPCGAYVACHWKKVKGSPGVVSKRSKGTPAHAADRLLRRQAHAIFDPLWKRVAKRDGVPQRDARGRAYHWLAREMALSSGACHIALLHGDDLQRVIDICTPPFGANSANRGTTP